MSSKIQFRIRSIRHSLDLFLVHFLCSICGFLHQSVEKCKAMNYTWHDGKHSFLSTEYLRPFDGNPGYLSTAALGNTHTHTHTLKIIQVTLGKLAWNSTCPTDGDIVRVSCFHLLGVPLSLISAGDPGVSVSSMSLPYPTSTGSVRRTTFQRQLGAVVSRAEGSETEERSKTNVGKFLPPFFIAEWAKILSPNSSHQ